MFDFIDIEASSLHPVDSYPIEVGCSISYGFSYLIRPMHNWHDWDDNAESHIHNISRKMLHKHGICPYNVCNLLNERLNAGVYYSDAYENDSFWINKLFKDSSLDMSFKLKPVNQLLEQLEISQIRFWKIRNELVDEKQHHRALYDANLSKRSILKCLGM